MEEELFKSLNELHDALRGDPRIVRLNELEEKLYKDNNVIELTKKKDDLERDYVSCLSYSDYDSPLAKEKQKALYEAKLELDSYPLVKEYNEAFTTVRDIYMKIDDIIYGPFRSKTLSSEAK